MPAISSPDSAPAVIETKLRVPLPRPEQVPRPRLLVMLEEGLDCRVTLVSAPADYGKTILLSQWCFGCSGATERGIWPRGSFAQEGRFCCWSRGAQRRGREPA